MGLFARVTLVQAPADARPPHIELVSCPARVGRIKLVRVPAATGPGHPLLSPLHPCASPASVCPSPCHPLPRHPALIRATPIPHMLLTCCSPAAHQHRPTTRQPRAPSRDHPELSAPSPHPSHSPAPNQAISFT
jgi:hypothetical protein